MNGLYAVTPDEADSERLFALVERVLAGGAPWLQYRNKKAGEAQRAREARRSRARTPPGALPDSSSRSFRARRCMR